MSGGTHRIAAYRRIRVSTDQMRQQVTAQMRGRRGCAESREQTSGDWTGKGSLATTTDAPASEERTCTPTNRRRRQKSPGADWGKSRRRHGLAE